MEPRVFRINVGARSLFGGFTFFAGVACLVAAIRAQSSVLEASIFAGCGVLCLVAGYIYFTTARARTLVVSEEGISEFEGSKPRWSYGWDQVANFNVSTQAGYAPRMYVLKLKTGKSLLIDGFYMDQIKLAAAIIDYVDQARFRASHSLKASKHRVLKRS